MLGEATTLPSPKGGYEEVFCEAANVLCLDLKDASFCTIPLSL